MLKSSIDNIIITTISVEIASLIFLNSFISLDVFISCLAKSYLSS